MPTPRRVQLEVLPRDDKWQVTRDGDLCGISRTQTEGIDLAMSMVKVALGRNETVSLKIKRPDGRIREERTYPRSSDPRRTKG
jgi:hypothetical protein